MVMVTTVPPVCNKTMFTQALNVSARCFWNSLLHAVWGVLLRAPAGVLGGDLPLSLRGIPCTPTGEGAPLPGARRSSGGPSVSP